MTRHGWQEQTNTRTQIKYIIPLGHRLHRSSMTPIIHQLAVQLTEARSYHDMLSESFVTDINETETFM